MSRMPFILVAFLHLSDMVIGKTITQQPGTLNLSKSETAMICCNWTSNYAYQVRAEWRKQISSNGEDNGTVLCSVLKSENNSSSSVRNNRTTCNVTNNTTLLTIEGVTEDDGGRYVCKVTWEIPALDKAEGNGTQLYVHDGNSGGLQIHIPAIGVTAIFPFLALAAYCAYKRRKQKSEKIPQRRRQEHGELNQIHQNEAESEEEDSSGHSVQWAESSLYESFDYFAIRNPDDKAAASSTANLAKPKSSEESSLSAV
ncbi:uncharacterized protein [Dendrobates tinctorius]|uniref:uncharacterized protein n=1 Tax=Dendrobates tinctorius TaxID=92724 RepID=UPI003CC95936